MTKNRSDRENAHKWGYRLKLGAVGCLGLSMLSFCLGALLLVIAAQDAEAGERVITGTAQVQDGDSLIVKGKHIRLSGLDAPELAQICTRDGQEWACGRDASALLLKEIAQRKVTCRPEGKDHYGRILASCAVEGQDLGRALVSAGMAVAYRRYSDRYIPAEDEARAAKRGMWAGEFKLPEAWRHSEKP